MTKPSFPPVVQMSGITKSFGGVPVLKGIDLQLDAGQVIGLLGVNGAGKSTLIKILSGVYQGDAGRIELDGQAVQVDNAAIAQGLGIRTVHQELSLIRHLRVYENVYLRSELTRGARFGAFGLLRRQDMIRGTEQVLEQVLRVPIPATAIVADLTIAEQQVVEIARAVHEQAKVLILDEPTTSLEAREKERLFAVIRDVRATGTAVVFISHHLDEVMELCDRTVVLRDGELVLDSPTSELTQRDMVVAMSGRPVDNQYPKQVMELGETVLEVQDLSHKTAYRHVSFNLQRREILGIVGLAGCGKSELIRGLAGAVPVAAGQILLHGNPVRLGNLRRVKQAGLVYLPSDRKQEGVFPEQTVRWNMTIATLRRWVGWKGISPGQESNAVAQAIDTYGVKVSSTEQVMSHLSGGNQQKVLLARCLMESADILLLDDPTRGIDVNAKNDIYQLLTELVSQGKSVILVSSEETEVLGMCDRIIVMREGEIRAELNPALTSLSEIRLVAMSSEGVLR